MTWNYYIGFVTHFSHFNLPESEICLKTSMKCHNYLLAFYFFWKSFNILWLHYVRLFHQHYLLLIKYTTMKGQNNLYIQACQLYLHIKILCHLSIKTENISINRSQLIGSSFNFLRFNSEKNKNHYWLNFFPFKLKITPRPLGNVYLHILDYLLYWIADYHWENWSSFFTHWNDLWKSQQERSFYSV